MKGFSFSFEFFYFIECVTIKFKACILGIVQIKRFQFEKWSEDKLKQVDNPKF